MIIVKRGYSEHSGLKYPQKSLKGFIFKISSQYYLESYQISLLFPMVDSFLSNCHLKIGKSEPFDCRGVDVRKKVVRKFFFKCFNKVTIAINSSLCEPVFVISKMTITLL